MITLGQRLRERGLMMNMCLTKYFKTTRTLKVTHRTLSIGQLTICYLKLFVQRTKDLYEF